LDLSGERATRSMCYTAAVASSAVVHYFDYKSPYAYLAQAETFRLRDELGIAVEWLPYTLDIPAFLGNAQLDAAGRDIVGERNAHQWRRVRYLYMDCRREARQQGIVIRGPRKVFDSSVAHIGFLYASERGDFRPYHQQIFARFWRRELEIEDPAVIASVLAESGVDPSGFGDYLAGAGRAKLAAIQAEAEAKGVFGVPSYRVGDELFWGNERIAQVRERAAAGY
jgi:2-hydroxychromene-2-carboxylate isomerase